MNIRFSLVAAVLTASLAFAQTPADPATARQAFQDGAKLQKDGKHAEAVAKFEAALKADSRPGFRYALAVSLLELGKKDDAVKQFKQFLKDTDDPAAADARYATAQLEDLLVPKLTAAQRRKLEAIEDAFEAAKELGDDGNKKEYSAFNSAVSDLYALHLEAPGHLPLLLKLGRAYELRRNYSLAAAAYTKYMGGYGTLGFNPSEVRDARRRFVVCRQMGGEPSPGEEQQFEIADGVKMTFCWIPKGKAIIGSPETEKGRVENEAEHEYDEKLGFWLGKYPVTQRQWTAVMGTSPFGFYNGEKSVKDLKREAEEELWRGIFGQGKKSGAYRERVADLHTEEFPAEMVSWDDAQEFLKAIRNHRGVITAFGKAGKIGLPSDDRWEYAYRGGLGNRW